MNKSLLYRSIKNEWKKLHSKKEKKKIKLHEPTFGVEEIFNFTKQLITTNVTMGKQVQAFEKKICENLDLNMRSPVTLVHPQISL